MLCPPSLPSLSPLISLPSYLSFLLSLFPFISFSLSLSLSLSLALALALALALTLALFLTLSLFSTLPLNKPRRGQPRALASSSSLRAPRFANLKSIVELLVTSRTWTRPSLKALLMCWFMQSFRAPLDLQRSSLSCGMVPRAQSWSRRPRMPRVQPCSQMRVGRMERAWCEQHHTFYRGAWSLWSRPVAL